MAQIAGHNRIEKLATIIDTKVYPNGNYGAIFCLKDIFSLKEITPGWGKR